MEVAGNCLSMISRKLNFILLLQLIGLKYHIDIFDLNNNMPVFCKLIHLGLIAVAKGSIESNLLTSLDDCNKYGPNKF